MNTETQLRIGQHWRDEDGYVMRVVGFAQSSGWPYVRHVNARTGGMLTNPAWFDRWTMTKDLTPADVRRGYQCDRCADAEEGCC